MGEECSKKYQIILLETPSNPLGEVVDIEKLAAISKKNKYSISC